MTTQMKPPLDAELRSFVGYRLKRAMNVFSSDLAITLRPFDLRMITFSTLSSVVSNPGIRQSQLAETLAVERPNLVSIVDELANRDLIERKRDNADRRAFGLFATEAGTALFQDATRAVIQHETQILSALSEQDIETLTALLARIEQAK